MGPSLSCTLRDSRVLGAGRGEITPPRAVPLPLSEGLGAIWHRARGDELRRGPPIPH